MFSKSSSIEQWNTDDAEIIWGDAAALRARISRAEIRPSFHLHEITKAGGHQIDFGSDSDAVYAIEAPNPPQHVIIKFTRVCHF